MERLDKILSATGKYSRREVKELVRQGHVTVDGTLAKAAEQKLDPDLSSILVDGESIIYRRFCYLMLHKPAGVLSAVEDSRQKTVLDLLAPEYKRQGLSPVGRLDKDTEGLLILTNDGELTHRLLSPKYHVDKVYYAQVEAELEHRDTEAFELGIELSDFTCLPAKLEILSPRECLVTIHEGKFHQVKRMLASCGKPVTYLKRIKMGAIALDTALEKGKYRPLRSDEVLALYQATGMNYRQNAIK